MEKIMGPTLVTEHGMRVHGRLTHRTWRRTVNGTEYEFDYTRTAFGFDDLPLARPLVTVTAVPVVCLTECTHPDDECSHMLMWREIGMDRYGRMILEWLS